MTTQRPPAGNGLGATERPQPTPTAYHSALGCGNIPPGVACAFCGLPLVEPVTAHFLRAWQPGTTNDVELIMVYRDPWGNLLNNVLHALGQWQADEEARRLLGLRGDHA